MGTVVVVNINDVSDMRFTLSMSNKSNSQRVVNPDMTITGFLPKVALRTERSTNDDSTQFAGKGKFAFSVATTGHEQGGAHAERGREPHLHAERRHHHHQP